MKNCKVIKSGSKWAIVDTNGNVIYKGKTRVSCFRWAHANGYKVTEYQHGGN